MAKKKFLVESITQYVFRHQIKDGPIVEGTFKINGDYNTAEADIKSKKNAGGEAWDWAQSHWDEFVPEKGPSVTVDLRRRGGVRVTIPSILRWVCVQGVYSKNGKHLPIQEVSYKTGRSTSYAKSKKKERGKTSPKFKVEADTTSLREVAPSQKKAKTPDNKRAKKPDAKLSVVEKLTEGTDVESYRQEKIRQVMEDGDEG